MWGYGQATCGEGMVGCSNVLVTSRQMLQCNGNAMLGIATVSLGPVV